MTEDENIFDEPAQPWIGVDLDGTLAVYTGYEGSGHIGRPIPLMVKRVKAWRKAGIAVKILTARVSGPRDGVIEFQLAWQGWSFEVLGEILPVTNRKDYQMLELWDDRAVQVEANTGRLIGVSTRGFS